MIESDNIFSKVHVSFPQEEATRVFSLIVLVRLCMTSYIPRPFAYISLDLLIVLRFISAYFLL